MTPTHDSAALGFRVWLLTDQGRLQSIIDRHLWYQGQNAASCNAKLSVDRLFIPHRLPATNCQCGFHAYHSIEDALAHADKLWSVLGLNTIVGTIAGSGDIQVHYDGFRCQWAQPLALLAEPRHHAATVFRGCQFYQIEPLDQELIADQDSYDYVATIDSSLRPEAGGRLIQEQPNS